MISYLSPSDSRASIRIQTLIVDDDRISRESLLKILQMVGIHATGAVNLSQGIDALQELPNNLILDLMLPDGNGIEILRRIRENNLPIRVAVLSGADRPMLAEVQKLKPDAVFVKPVDLRPLLDWLKAG